MKVGEVVGATDWSEGSETTGWLAELLRREGVDLMGASELELDRGTPVFVEATADVEEVQRMMAKRHIRRLPVLEGEDLIGLVDLLELAEHASR